MLMYSTTTIVLKFVRKAILKLPVSPFFKDSDTKLVHFPEYNEEIRKQFSNAQKQLETVYFSSQIFIRVKEKSVWFCS